MDNGYVYVIWIPSNKSANSFVEGTCICFIFVFCFVLCFLLVRLGVWMFGYSYDSIVTAILNDNKEKDTKEKEEDLFFLFFLLAALLLTFFVIQQSMTDG